MLFLLTSFSLAAADDLSFTMSAPTIVEVGKQFSLSLRLNAQGEDLRLPSLDNFKVLMGPSVSSSRNFSMVNGKMSQSVEYAYTYVLMAEKEGTFTIMPATIKSGKKTVQSNSLSIQAIKGRQQQSQQNGSTAGGSQSAQQSSSSGQAESLFIRYEVDKHNVYKGETIGAMLKLYKRVNLSIEDQKLPSFDGFWSQDIEIPDVNQTAVREAVDGVIYEVYTLQKKILIPQQSGKLTIEPAEMIFNVQKRVASQSIFDDFFGSYQNVRVSAKTKPITINVKDLPTAPAGFGGAVGEFALKSSIDRDQLKANEAVSMKVVVSGTGNLRHITPLKFDFPPDFEVYDPKTTYNHKSSMAGINGTTVFEYLLIPRYAGEFTIPAETFVYFNTKTQKYCTLSTQTFNIKVEKGADDATASMATTNGVSKENIKFLGKDIRYIKEGTPDFRTANTFFFGSLLFFIIMIGALLAFILILILLRKKARDNADIALMRNRKASAMARKHLRAASICVKNNDKEHFYEALAKAFWGYLSDKLTIPMSQLNRDNAQSTLVEYNIDQDTIDEFVKVIDTCEMARFAPTAISDSMEELYSKSEKLIGAFEKQIRRKS